MRFKRNCYKCLFVIFAFISLSFTSHSVVLANENATEKIVHVKLERVYLDGEISEEIVLQTVNSLEELSSFYEGWSLVDEKEEFIHLRKEIDDISPLLKLNGYFGISGDGFLNIYDGRPIEDKVIQSFFRINTKKLKSHQHIELQEGIPVMSRENYHDVLKMYKEYAVTEL